MNAKSPHHDRPVAHFLFPILVWIESIWIFFGTLSFISAIFYVLGNMQEFTATTLNLLVSLGRVSGLLCAVFALSYLALGLVFRIGGGPRRFGHLVLSGVVFLLALFVSLFGFAIDTLAQPVS
jgi:hypothetical protein